MRFLVTGGGTGGHIYPAIAVLKEMLSILPRTQVLYVGTEGGMERELTAKEGIPFQTVRSGGVARKSPKDALRGLSLAGRGIADARSILRRFKPDVVLGTGGYASFPVVAAAYTLGIPRAIQEQNAIPGKTNLVLSRIAHRILCGWDDTKGYMKGRKGLVVTGNPVRKDLFGVTKDDGLKAFGLQGEGPVILLLGGSRGALTLVRAGERLAKTPGVSMIFITGKEYYPGVVERLGAVAQNGIDGARIGNIIIQPYVYNMALAYGASDLVLGRGGGMTLSEIAALGLPGVIVPSPNVANDEQTHNARALEKLGAVLVLKDEGGEETAERIAGKALSLLEDEGLRSKMSASSRRAGKPDAATNICRELIDLARELS